GRVSATPPVTFAKAVRIGCRPLSSHSAGPDGREWQSLYPEQGRGGFRTGARGRPGLCRRAQELRFHPDCPLEWLAQYCPTAWRKCTGTYALAVDPYPSELNSRSWVTTAGHLQFVIAAFLLR